MCSCRALLVLLFVFIAVIGCAFGNKGVSDILLAKEGVEDNYTITGPFNPKKDKCCRGVLHPNSKRELERCCGSLLYDVTKQLCCSGTISEYNVASACCGQEVFDTDNALCCERFVIPIDLEARNTSKCCGSKVVDSRTSVCCASDGGMVVLDNDNGKKNHCCEDKTYDLTTEICCAEMTNERHISFTVVPRDGDKSTCCGNKLYDDEIESCCGFKIVPANVACCGGQTLNASEICCWNGDNTFSPKVPPTPKHECCGSGGFFNPQTQLCCGNTIFDNPGKGVLCCGTDQTYNEASDLCCPQAGGLYQVVVKTDSEQDGCCGPTPYNQATEYCCDINSGKVAKKLTQNADACCGDMAYRFNEGICCNNKFFAGPWYLLRCCNGEGFKTNESKCCGGKLSKFQQGIDCCGDKEMYNSTTHRCCVDYFKNPPDVAVVAMQHELQSCCGLQLYDATVGICCGREIIPHSSGKSCCARQQFDEKTQVCCGMSLLPRKEDETACCYSFITDEFNGQSSPWEKRSVAGP